MREIEGGRKGENKTKATSLDHISSYQENPTSTETREKLGA